MENNTFLKKRKYSSVLLYIAGIVLSCMIVNAQKHSTGYAQEKWKVKEPFEQKVFIENNEGQFDGLGSSKDDKVLFSTVITGIKVYLTSGGIIYRYTKYPETTQKDAEEERGKEPLHESYVFKELWEGANKSPEVLAEDEVTFYYCYPKSCKHTTIAHAFKKLLYKNVYPGIDIEYSFKEDKKGIEYLIIAHPGADLSKVKLQYPDVKSISMNASGDVEMKSPMGLFTDNAPAKAYCKETGKEVSVNYIVSGKEESFIAGEYDNANTLIIDPFKTNPAFVGYNAAYDVCYDDNGNVYAYGSFSWFQEAKINNLGALQWIFTAVFPLTWGGVQYGDFAVDEVNGTSYLTSSGYAMILKVNTLGKQVDSMDVSGTMNEIWRMTYNRCENKIIMGGGGTVSNYQLASLDTSLTTFNPVNVLATGGGHHDVYFLSIANTNKYVYMATALSTLDGFYANDMEKVPITGFLPIQWSISDGFSFTESCCDANYVNGVGGHALGLNGIANSPNWIYGYDGATLRRYNKSTGAIASSTVISPTKYSWGGIDVDVCDNIYLVKDTVVNIYDSALTVIGNIHPGYQVYDMHIMPNNQICTAGKGFISAFNITTNALTISKIRTGANCGKNNGTAFAQLTGCGNDSSQYNYLWSNGATTQKDTGLGIGVYTVTISSNCDFKYSDTVKITGNSTDGITLSTLQANVKCFGDSNATASVIASGGKPPYTYTWAPNVSTSASASNLKAGTYQVTVSDSAGCNSALITITQPTQLTVTATNTTIECFGGNSGTATATPAGGTGTYTYVWSPTGITSAAATSLTAGCYTITVRDNNGCTVTASTCITNAPALTVSVTNTPVKCNGGASGTATATAGGGTGSYTYNWTPSGGTNATANNLTATTYTITVTDNNGCTATASTSITQPLAALTSLISGNIDVKCNGGSTGSATAAASGGTAAYTYNWAPSGGNSTTASNLTAGTYTITVTDNNGCTSTSSATITQPIAITASTATAGATCNKSDGSANVTASGGTGTYTYSWAPSGGSNTTASNLSSGTYTVTITDANGCTKTASAIVASTGGPSVSSVITGIKCNGDNTGAATANPTGGAAPYTYNWSSGGGSNATASNLSAGTYTCTITDKNGCTVKDTVSITQPAAIAGTANSSNAICSLNNGTATVTASGGTGALKYSWAPSGGTNATAIDLSAGTYTVTITDANGCTETASTIVNTGAGPSISISNDTIINKGDSTIIFASGGVSYIWSPDTNLSCDSCPAPIATPSATTIYCVLVKDKNGCSTSKCVTIGVEIPCADFTVPNVFTPNDDGKNDDFVIHVLNPSSYKIDIYDRWGKEVYTSADPTVYWNGRITGTQYLVSDGVYYYIIKSTCGTNNYIKKGFVQVIGEQ